LAVAAGNTQVEAYATQELGFLLLREGEPEAARCEFLNVVGLAPGAGIVNLTGNGLGGMGVALLVLGRTDEAAPSFLARSESAPRSGTWSSSTSTSCIWHTPRFSSATSRWLSA
jgi:hypothetical protein